MARQIKPLSVKEIESAKPKEADYVLYDGDGLELLIKSSGSKIWQFRYIRPVTKKRAKKSIGPYPSVTLADARNYRVESRCSGIARAGAPHSRHSQIAPDWRDVLVLP